MHTEPATMRSVFVVAVLLFALAPLNDAGCWTGELRRGVTHCQDGLDKTWHPVGSSWTNSKCDKCRCGEEYMSCCYGMPSVHHPDDCTVEYDYHTCTYRVFKKNDRSVECRHAASLK